MPSKQESTDLRAEGVDSTASAPYRGGGLLDALGKALPLLAGLGLLMAGSGLTSTLLGIRAGLEGFTPAVTGVVLAAYYVGFVAGSLASPGIIRRVGHIRAFAGLASIASAAVLVHVISPDPLSWLLLRAVTGVCFSGLFVVTETWLNGAATNANRGSLLSSYMVVLTGGIGAGQLLLTLVSPAGFGAFVLASVLVSFAVVPVSLTSVTAPQVPDPTPLSIPETLETAPLAIVGAAGAGFIAAAVLGTGAVYAVESGIGSSRTGLLIASVVVFALVAQYPIGRVSDRVDRRRVILALCMVGTGVAVVAAALGSDHFLLVLGCMAIAGGLSFPLYSLCSAHLNDYLSTSTVAAAGARMVLVNGVGAIAGPIAGAFVIEWAGADSFFLVPAVCYAAVGLYTVVRLARRDPVPADQRSEFVPYALGTATTVVTLAPHSLEELYPATGGDLDADGVRLRWWERGSGPPVVIVHDAGSSSTSWDSVAVFLASTGHRLITWDLRGHGRSSPGEAYGAGQHVSDLLAVLADRGVAEATLVGHGAGAGIVAAFTQGHTERVHAVVLVSAGEAVSQPDRRPARMVERAVEEAVGAVMRDPVPESPASGSPFRRRPPEHRRVLTADRQRARQEAVVGTRRSVRTSVTPRQILSLPVPTLVVRGPGERSLAGAVDELVVPGTGHFVQLEQPEVLADAIIDFMWSASRSDGG